MVKSWLVQDQTVLGKDYSNLLIADSLLKTIWFINAPCYGNEALASPKANAKDVDEDGKCLKIRSRCVKVFGYILQELKKINLKKHEVKQVQQSCLGEDCWELYIPDLVPLDSAYTISIHSQCFSIIKLYLYKLAITLSRVQRSVQFGTHKLGMLNIDSKPEPSALTEENQRKSFTRSPYKEYLSEFWYSAKALDNSKVSFSIPTGGIYRVLGLNTFRKAIRAHYMSHSSDYVDPPSIDIALRPNHTKGPPFTAHMLAICNVEKPVAFKAPRTSSQTKKKVSQGTKPGAGGPTSLMVTSEEGAHPQLSMSAFSKLKPIYSASVIIHSKSASGYDASANSTAEADPGTSAPNDYLLTQQGKDEGTKNYSLDHIFIGTGPNIIAYKTKSVSDGLETVLATPEIGTKNAAKQSEEIKLEDLVKLVLDVKADFKDLDSPEDDPIIVVDNSEEDEEEDINEEIHSTMNDKTKYISASIPPSPRDLKELPTKLEEFTMTVTCLISQVAELKSLQWELLTKFLSVPNQVASAQANMKTLDALSSLLLKVTQALNMFAKVLTSASKAIDQRVPSAGQASTMPAEGEKNINQATISQLFQRRAEKNTERKNLNKPQPETTSPPNPPIITTTTYMQSPFLSYPPESSSQPEGEQTKINKGKKALYSKDAEEESTKSDYDDDETYMTSSMVESTRIKKAKKFDFATEDGKHIHLIKEQINQQKEIEEEAKAEAARCEGEIRKEDMIDLLGP
ncbi:hypothetical protein Tco_0837115 [Tanacetum coccineum]